MTDNKKEFSSREQIKSHFKTGDRPTQAQFDSWINAGLLQGSDNIYGYNDKIGIGTQEPIAPLSVIQPEPGDNSSLSFSASALLAYG